MGKPILTLQGLSKFYTSSQSVVVGLNNINLSFEVGEFVAVTGESGSGKSTLGHVLGGIIPYEGGELLLSGKPTSHYDGSDWEEYRRDKVSFISQSYGILPGSSVLGNIITALLLSGASKKDAKKKALDILHKVELYPFRNRKAAKLSSGQKQRLSIARALAKPSQILIADEPTGNLDAKNSAEIIKLLADAAKDRLVILITHEFSEAEDYVTRKITLRDGKLVSDMKLRDASEESPAKDPRAVEKQSTAEKGSKKKARKKSLVGYIGILQIRMRPIWTTIMIFFFVLTSFSVFAFLGNFIIALDDTSTREYDNSAFRNGDPERIVVTRPDGTDLTEDDFKKLVSIKHVSSLERYGYLADINFPYRQNEDYRSRYTLEDTGESVVPSYRVTESISIVNFNCYQQTVPVLPEGVEFLTAGRLPEKFHEVVMVGGEELIGEKFTLIIQDIKRWNVNALVTVEAEVVGVTDFGEGIYLSDYIGRMVTHVAMSGETQPYFGIRYDETLTDPETGTRTEFKIEEGTYHAAEPYYTRMLYLGKDGVSFTTHDGGSLYLKLSGTHTSTQTAYFEICEADFERIVSKSTGDQISLYIKDYAYTDRVLSAISELGYSAVSPYREGATEVIAELANTRMQTLIICGVVLIVLIALQIIVQRAMFGMQTESYRLLSDIGLTGKTAIRSVYLQVFVFTLLGQCLGFGSVFLLSNLGVERIESITKYLPPDRLILLSLFHIGICMLTAVWIVRALRNRVYPKAVKLCDLSFNEIEGEEEEA